MKLEQFESVENNKKSRATLHKVTSEKVNYASAALKIGICALLCIVLCIANVVTSPENSFFASSDDDSPGKLRFVELPGIIEVFAGGDRLTMPIGEYHNAELDKENLVLTLATDSNATVVTCSSGTVKAIGKDKDFGIFVAITHGDIDAYYYGLEYVTVEERQVINKLDTLGLLSQSGIMRFKVYENGIPANPCDYLPINID